MKTMTLGDFLTDAEINLAAKIFVEDRNHFHQRVMAEILKPNMARINAALGQENHAAYLAYAIEYAMGAFAKKHQ